MRKLPIGVRPFEKLNLSNRTKEISYQCSVLFLTYISYIGYHMARKSLSIVKTSEKFVNCSSTICSSWITELDDKSENAAMTSLGLLDTTYLVTYAIFVFVIGPVAERVDLRIFLTIGMLGTGIMNILFGLAYSTGIHSIWYFVAIQILFGMFQTTGWPGVLSVVANWFGNGKRGLIMGVWHSHTSIGNILGAVVAGIFAADNWGLSFIVPGLIMVIIGVIIFFFLVPDPSIVGLAHERYQQLESTHSSKSSSSSSITNLMENAKFCSDLTTSDFECEPLVPQKDQAIGFIEAFKIPGVVEYSVCLFFANLVGDTFMYWLPNLIYDTTNLDAASSANLSTVFDVGGIVGAVLAGLLFDWSRMGATTSSAMFLLSIPSLFIYQYLQADWCPIIENDGSPIFNTCYALNVSLLLVNGVFINGPFALIMTAVAADLGTHPSLRGSKNALATVIAIINGAASIGSAVGPSITGWLADGEDWGNVFTMMIVADTLAALLLGRIVVQEVRNKWMSKNIFD